MSNYVIYHCHTMLSNGVTNIDSVTSYTDYVKATSEFGMKALGFSEHGCVFEWYKKKQAIEKAGMKYIHAEEFYLTSTLEKKIRDNMHCVLIARNYEGLKELNRLSSMAFNRNTNNFYFVPRISFDDLYNMSDNIIVTSACLAGPINQAESEDKSRFISFMMAERSRCFFEIQHHIDPEQVAYNKLLYELSKETGVRLIAGTDTHCLNKEHEEARAILQKSKGIHFDSEDNLNLNLMNYDELVAAYKKQNSLPKEVYLDAIDMTNEMAEMVDEYSIDTHTKYPHIYDDSDKAFRDKVNEGYKENKYVSTRYKLSEVKPIIQNEYEVYKKVGAFDFMLLERYLLEWERKNGIERGYGRGSVNGSFIAYLMGITEMDSIKFDLNFFRFMNPDRVTNADIDVDYSGKDRDAVKTFLLRDKMDLPQIRTSEIITFNTVKLKGAIKDIARALGIPLNTAQDISDAVTLDDNHNQIIDESYRKKYPELFKYADVITDVVVSVGSHPSGVLVSDRAIDEEVGLCSIKGSEYPVSQLYMKELDDLMYVKLSNIGWFAGNGVQ